MRSAIIVAASVFLITGSVGPAAADGDKPDAESCLTSEMATEAAGRALEGDPGARLMVFAGPDAAALLKAINDQPPQTDFRADRILVLEREAKDDVQIGLMVDGCFKGPSAIREADWQKLKEAVAAQLSS